MYPLKQSTSFTGQFFAHDANGDAVNSIADGSWTKRISKAAGTWAAMTVTITFQENGWYTFTLSTSHTDTLGLLSLTFTATGAKQVNLQFRVHARIFDDLAHPGSAVASVSGAVGSVTGAVGSVTGNVGGNVVGSVGSLGATAKSDVNAEVVDVMNVDTWAEIGQLAPPAAPTFRQIWGLLYKAWRNKTDQTDTLYQLYDDAGTTVDQKRTISSSPTQVDAAEVVSGP